MTILITGGSGFIGSHMAAFLLSNECDFIVLDNLSNSDTHNIQQLEKKFNKKISFYQVDLTDLANTEQIFSDNNIQKVIHFAALKSVNESIQYPDLYFTNNVTGSSHLIHLCKKYGIKNFIFSSSACVYGQPEYLPIDEKHHLQPTNPYGHSKVAVEDLLTRDDYFQNHCSTKILRYFNPIGAFDDGLIGERPLSKPNNLMPYILGVVQGLYPVLRVYGNDYNTHDGTAIRDYIHIMDLIDAHAFALNDNNIGVEIFNVGTGQGYSVLDIISTFNQVNGTQLPYEFHPRRQGDVETCFADVSKIKTHLGWCASRNLTTMCRDAYNFSIKK